MIARRKFTPEAITILARECIYWNLIILTRFGGPRRFTIASITHDETSVPHRVRPLSTTIAALLSYTSPTSPLSPPSLRQSNDIPELSAGIWKNIVCPVYTGTNQSIRLLRKAASRTGDRRNPLFLFVCLWICARWNESMQLLRHVFSTFWPGGHFTKTLLDSLGLLSFVVVELIISTILKVHVVWLRQLSLFYFSDRIFLPLLFLEDDVFSSLFTLKFRL